MEIISQNLEITGLVTVIIIGFLIILLIDSGSTITELRGRVMSLEETLEYKDRDLRHKGKFITEMQAKLNLFNPHLAPTPAPEIKTYKSVRLIGEIEKGRSIESDKFFISQDLRRAAEPYIEWTEGAGGRLRGILTVYTIDNE